MDAIIVLHLPSYVPTLSFLFLSAFLVHDSGCGSARGPPAPDNSSPAGAPGHDSNYDSRAEHELFEKANAERAKAGVPLLREDDSLARAARQHCSAMATHKEISHRFVGEPALMDRIAVVSNLHADTVAENVAFADS